MGLLCCNNDNGSNDKNINSYLPETGKIPYKHKNRHDKSCIVIVSQKYFMTIIHNSNVSRVDNSANLALCTYQKLYDVRIHSFLFWMFKVQSFT